MGHKKFIWGQFVFIRWIKILVKGFDSRTRFSEAFPKSQLSSNWQAIVFTCALDSFFIYMLFYKLFGCKNVRTNSYNFFSAILKTFFLTLYEIFLKFLNFAVISILSPNWGFRTSRIKRTLQEKKTVKNSFLTTSNENCDVTEIVVALQENYRKSCLIFCDIDITADTMGNIFQIMI